MNSISEYIIALFELAEAEGRTLKQQVIKVITTFVLLIVFAFFILSAYVLLIFGLHTYFTSFMPAHQSAFILSGITFVFALSLIGIIKWKS